MSLSFKEPKNPNYAAVVTTVRAINKLDNCDNVVGVPVFGYQAIVGKETEIDDLVIVFTAETQLSDEFVKANNLYRDATMNADPEKKGYIEANRRIRAIKFRGHRSDALVMPLTSIEFTGIDVSKLKEGDTFDEIAGIEICRKYEVEKATRTKGTQAVVASEKRVDKKFMPEHIQTIHWFRMLDSVPDDAEIIVTQKLHGTSLRLGHIPVRRELKWYEKLAKKLGVVVQEFKYEHVYGSRRVIKDANNPEQAHFYTNDVWSDEGKKYDAVIPQNFVVYAELIGWTGDTALQDGYTYNVPNGQAHMYVYRVMMVTNDGKRYVELSWDAVKRFCVENGLMYTPEFFRGRKGDLVERINDLMDRRYYDDVMNAKLVTTDMPVPLSDPKLVDEGVCIRINEGGLVTPTIYKAKAPAFLAHETKMLDNDVVDLESTYA